MYQIVTFKLVMFLLLILIQICSCGVENVPNVCYLKIGIIGAGPSGLSTAKNSIEQGHSVTIYEQNDSIGGIWVYDEAIGKNKYGINIHTPMYEGLRTNSPHQLMEFPNHHYPNGTISFPPQSDVLAYLHSYADRFNLKTHIKYNHLVVRVLPIESDKWEVIVKDLPNDKFITEIYDAVFVCNGHFFKPNIPIIDGADKFNGKIIHSHDVRRLNYFRDERVLIIGAGISGIELAVLLLDIAKEITLSIKIKPNGTDRFQEALRKTLPGKINRRNNVIRIAADGAEFIDGTKQTFTSIIYATGYRYSYPFLSIDSGIHVDDNFVQPLYKHIFNIEHPTMAFIGIPISTIDFRMYDLQARFALKFLSGRKKLPSKSEMLLNLKAETEIRWNEGCQNSMIHFLTPTQKTYCNELSKLADIQDIPIILHLIWELGLRPDITGHPTEFRKFKYTIIDDTHFIKKLE